MYTVLLVAHTILVVFLIFMVLLQRTDSDGLGGLGGGGGNQFMTGRSTANFMTRTTAILAGGFMATSLMLAIMASQMTGKSIVDSVPVGSSQTGAKTTDTNVDSKTTPEPKTEAPVAPKPE